MESHWDCLPAELQQEILWQRWKQMLGPVHAELCRNVEPWDGWHGGNAFLYLYLGKWTWLPSWGEW